MAAQVSFEVEKEILTSGGNGIKSCDWGRLMEKRLQEEYGDMYIKLESTHGKTLTFTMEFTNRPTTEPDIRSRIYEFLRYYPAMEIQSLKIELLA